jgi:hypothetical protein
MFPPGGASDEDDGNRRCCRLGRKDRRWPERADHRHVALHKIARHRRQWIITIRDPAVFDGDVATFHITHFGKTAAERGVEMYGIGLREAAEISDHRHRRLLRARRERPRGCRATDERDELAPSHCLMSRASHCKE